MTKTPKYRLKAQDSYRKKSVLLTLSRAKDSEQGILLAKAKADKDFQQKFWLFLEKNYK